MARAKWMARLRPQTLLVAAGVLGAGGIAAAHVLPNLQSPARPQAPAPCAESTAALASATGVSPADLQVLQSLGQRRQELDQRQAALDNQAAVLQAAEAKLDARTQVLEQVKAQVQALLQQASDVQDAETARMVAVYSAMKPKDAAARLVLLDDPVRLPIAAKMKPRILSAILSQMAPADAKALTEKLEARFAALQALSQQTGKTG